MDLGILVTIFDSALRLSKFFQSARSSAFSITAAASFGTPAGIAKPRPPPTWML